MLGGFGSVFWANVHEPEQRFYSLNISEASACLALITSQLVGQGHWQHACPCRHTGPTLFYGTCGLLRLKSCMMHPECFQKQLNWQTCVAVQIFLGQSVCIYAGIYDSRYTDVNTQTRCSLHPLVDRAGVSATSSWMHLWQVLGAAGPVEEHHCTNFHYFINLF